ncbi:MAG TPA: tRNA-dihydrouridine synthase [Candidatus Saccharimonadales bacterium]|nr:tRNA-dihydrouridine synthase [Candidatus Saccharimonadales bacterium]
MKGQNIYQQLPRPFFVLAPLDDVTDTVFRQIVIRAARPDLMVTEFVNADGFCSKGRDKVAQKLRFTPAEQPLIAQIWGLKPENFYETAKAVKEMGFVGIDLNMGCPERKVLKRGACAALISNPSLAAEMIAAVRRAVGPDFPVSVKTRIGLKEIITEEWIGFLLAQNLDALTVHLRTAAEMSLVPAHYEELAKVVALRNKIAPKTVIIANGDIATTAEGRALAKKYGVEGAMIGRGIFHNPFVFAKDGKVPTQQELFSLLLDHLNLHEQTWGNAKTYQPLKRFFKIYVKDFDGAAALRDALMKTTAHQQARELILQSVS